MAGNGFNAPLCRVTRTEKYTHKTGERVSFISIFICCTTLTAIGEGKRCEEGSERLSAPVAKWPPHRIVNCMNGAACVQCLRRLMLMQVSHFIADAFVVVVVVATAARWLQLWHSLHSDNRYSYWLWHTATNGNRYRYHAPIATDEWVHSSHHHQITHEQRFMTRDRLPIGSLPRPGPNTWKTGKPYTGSRWFRGHRTDEIQFVNQISELDSNCFSQCSSVQIFPTSGWLWGRQSQFWCSPKLAVASCKLQVASYIKLSRKLST